MDEEKIKFNEQEITKEEFNKKKEELEQKKGVKVIQISENTFKTRIQG